MNSPFHDLKIAGVLEERCHVVGGSVMRIYLGLSEAPPVGWSYLFCIAWQAAPHPLSRRVGVEGDTLWIECPPAEVLTHHLSELESSVTRANEMYWSAHRRRLSAEQQAREISNQARAQLAALADVLNPPSLTPTDEAHGSGPERRTRRLRDILEQIRDSLFYRSSRTGQHSIVINPGQSAKMQPLL